MSLNNALHNEDSSSSTASIDSVVKKEISQDAWVQCENSKCLKWRRIPKNVGEVLGDTPWFCFMNPDQEYSSCDDKQEDYKKFQIMAKKCRMKYVSTALIEGSLVWAKMLGYCRWPGIVCDDPVSGEYILKDEDGHPQCYHVEFLGESHSRGWINSTQVELFGRPQEEFTMSSHSNSDAGCSTQNTRVRGKGRKRGASRKYQQRDVRSSYKGNSVKFATTEAEQLIDMLPHERLEKIVFKKEDAVNTLNGNSTVETSNTSGEVTKKKRGRPFSKDKGTPTTKRKAKEGKSERSGASKQSQDNSASLNYNLNQSASLQGRSKEEKLAIDVEMYSRNQDGFEHDVSRFMYRQGLVMSRPPCWKDVPVTFFQLFLAVHERGGYEEVGQNKQWSSIYREVTNFPIDSASIIRKFYRKNLLPYELYINGKDYSDLIAEIKENHPHSVVKEERKKKFTKKFSPAKRRKRRSDQIKTNVKKDVIDNIDIYSFENEENMLYDEFNDTSSTFEILEESVKKACERLDLSFQFYEQGTSSTTVPCRASESGIAQLPGESAHYSATVSQHSSSSEELETGDRIDGNKEEAVDDDYMTVDKMQALQRELDAMNYEMIKYWE